VPDYDSSEETADLLMAVHEDAAPEHEREGPEDDAGARLAIAYRKVKDREFVFSLEGDDYHATLVNLPTVTEVQKTADEKSFFTTGNIGQMLLVHDVKLADGPRPDVPTEWPDGIAAPLRDVAKQRFEPVSSEARRQAAGLSMADVVAGDAQLSDMHKLVLQRQSMRRAASNKTDPKKASRATSTVFVHEEVVDSEPWMDQHPDEVITVEPGADFFVSSTEEAMRVARDAAAATEERHRLAKDKLARAGAPASSSSAAAAPTAAAAPPRPARPAGAPASRPATASAAAAAPKPRPTPSPVPAAVSASMTTTTTTESPPPSAPTATPSPVPSPAPVTAAASAAASSPAPVVVAAEAVVDPEVAALQKLEANLAREKNPVLRKKLLEMVEAMRERLKDKL